jgi:putative transposase
MSDHTPWNAVSMPGVGVGRGTWIRAVSRRSGFCSRDHDVKFTRSFEEGFCSEGAEVIRTPIRAPKANAHAERWVQTARAECLDWTLVLGRRHLLRLLCAYVRHYNRQRSHRGVALAVPEPQVRERSSPRVNPREVRRPDVLGGLIHEYHEVAA